MKYIVKITENGNSEYIAEGNSYIVNGCPYVPFTERPYEAKKYKSRKLAEKASQRTGENMHGTITIIEVDD